MAPTESASLPLCSVSGATSSSRTAWRSMAHGSKRNRAAAALDLSHTGDTMAPRPQTALRLEPRLADIHAAEYPRFSDAEMARRRTALERVMRDADVDHLLVCGEQRAGTGVGWLTSWSATTEAIVIVAPPEPQVMVMEWYNHWPLAKLLARDTEARWGEHRGVDKVITELKTRKVKRLGFMGFLGLAKIRKLEAAFGPLVDLNGEYVKLRLVKSKEEIDW